MSKSQRPATIWDVADEAGLSIATVSRALNNPGLLSKKTLDIVNAAVERLHYRPSLTAQNLRRARTNLILVAVPSLSPFFLDIFRGAEAAARQNGFSVLVGHTGRELARERLLMGQVDARRADGIIMVTSVDLAALCNAPPVPPAVVALDVNVGTDLPTVRVDHVAAARKATEYLVHIGHRRIAHIAGARASGMTSHRLEGFKAALEANGLPFEPELCVQGDFTVETGAAAMEELLGVNPRPTAVFAGNDQMAIGAMQAIRAHGLSVPGDISIFGFDDERVAGLYTPAISTIRIPTYEIGYQSMVQMTAMLQGEEILSDVILDTELIIRESTRPPKGAAQDVAPDPARGR